MILSVEYRHPTARKRFRRLHAGGARVINTCGCEACRLVAEENGVQMIWDPVEAKRRWGSFFLLCSEVVLEWEHGTRGVATELLLLRYLAS